MFTSWTIKYKPLLTVVLLLLWAEYLFAGELHPAGEELIVHPAAVVLDSTGSCWIGNPDGLYQFDGHWLNHQSLWEGYDGGGVLAMAVDPDGRLWVAAENGIYSLDERFNKMERGLLPEQSRVNQIAFWKGQPLLACNNGLYWIRANRERVLLSGVEILSLYVSPENEIFAGSAAEGLYHLDARGNPGSQNRELTSELPRIEQLSGSGNTLFLLGRNKSEQLSLFGLEDGRLTDVTPVLRTRPTAAHLSDARLMRIGNSVALFLESRWQLLSGENRGQTLRMGQTGMNWPLEHPEGWLPRLFQQALPGSLKPMETRQGILVPDGTQPLLIPLAAGGVPVQILSRELKSGLQRLLLIDQEGQRSLYTSRAESGFRKIPFPEIAGTEKALSVCWFPGDYQDRLLVAFRDRILEYQNNGRWRTLDSKGARWMQPVSREQILVAGDSGLSLYDGNSWQAMGVQEPVFRTAHDGLRDAVVECADYLLILNALNEVDTLAFPTGLNGEIRQLLLAPGRKVWILDQEELHLSAGRDGLWSRPLVQGQRMQHLNSIALDGRGGLFLASDSRTAHLIADHWPPLFHLQQNPDRLDLSRKLTISLQPADPFQPGARIWLRQRINEAGWSPWTENFQLEFPPSSQSLFQKGTNRLQIQLRDSWGNLSVPRELTLFLPEDAGRIRLARKAALLISLMAMVMALTLLWPGLPSLVLTLGLAVFVSSWIYVQTDEPYLWIVLPFLLLLIRKSTRLYRVPEEEGEVARGNPLYELVDLFREFGHSGVATRNLDRLLRSVRNLYDEEGVDEEMLRRFSQARQLFLDVTHKHLLEILQAFRRLPAEENPVAPAQLEQIQHRVKDLQKLIQQPMDPPSEAMTEELALQLAALEKQLSRLEKAIDRQVSASPLKVLDGLLNQKREELGGVSLQLILPRDLRELLIRLPVNQLQFILENLISNAVFWMRDAEQPELKIELRERPTRLQIFVSDNGSGIAENKFEQIFAAGQSGRSDGEGGYGLYRSREILARFGGKLVVKVSEPGRGTTFLLEAKKVEPED